MADVPILDKRIDDWGSDEQEEAMINSNHWSRTLKEYLQSYI